MGTGIELLKSDAVLWVADMVVTVVLLKGTLLAAALTVVVALSARASAAVRSTVWTLGFGALLALPLAWTLVPWWPAELVAFPTGLFEPLQALADRHEPGIAAAGTDASTDVAAPAEGLARLPLASFLACLWAAGVLFLLIRFCVQRAVVERLAREGLPLSGGPRLELARRIAGELGISRPLRLVEHPGLTTPATFGVRRPVVLLPTFARDWTPERLSAVLYHELAHVQRHDYLSLLLLELVRAFYWANPLVLLAAGKAREAQDHACDDTALRSGVTPPAYARHLTEVARALGVGRAAGAALPLVRRAGLRGRVRAVLASGADRSGVSGGVVVRLAALGLVASAALGSANLWICDAAGSAGIARAASAPDPVAAPATAQAQAPAQAPDIGIQPIT